MIISSLIIFLLLFFFNKKLIPRYWLLSQALILVAPWFIQTYISPIEFAFFNLPISSLSEFLHNLSYYTSTDFIFFAGDPRLAYGIQDYGLLYISWLPFLIIGLIHFIDHFPHQLIFWWLGLGLVIASLFKSVTPYSASLIYLPALQIIISLGFVYLITNFRQFHLWIKVLMIILLLFNFYEITNFFHALIIHYPHRLHEAITSI